MLKTVIQDHKFYQVLVHLRNYLGEGFLKALLLFFLIPVFSRILTPAEYGILSVFDSSIEILLVILTLNLSTAPVRYFYENKDDFNRFLGTVISFIIICLFFSFILIYVFKKELSSFLGLSPNLMIYFVPMVLPAIIYSIFRQIYGALKQSKRVALSGTLKLYAGYLVSIILIMQIDSNKYMGKIWGILVIDCIFTWYFILKLKPYFQWSLDKKYFRYIFSYSLPLIPGVLSFFLLNQVDRIMINKYLGESAAGLYSFAYNIGMFLLLFIGSLNSAYLPYYYDYMNTKNYPQINADINKQFKMIIFVACAIIAFGKDAGLVLAHKNFHPALQIIPLIAIGYVFFGIYFIFVRDLFYAKKTFLISLTAIIASAVNIVLNAIFIPKFGIIAGAYTTIAGFFTMALLIFIFGRRVAKISNISVKIILSSMLAFGGFIVLYFIIENIEMKNYVVVLAKFAIFSILGFFLFWDFIKRNYEKLF